MVLRALVTGASSGLGEQYARLLSQEGYQVELVARNPERLMAVARACGELSARPAVVTQVDLSDGTALHDLCRRSAADPPEFLVNCAGVARAPRFWEDSDEAQRELLMVNYHAPSCLIRAVLPFMIARGGGDILNVASVDGLIPGDPDMGYSASKAALICLTSSLATQLSGSGVRISATCPGFIPTRIHERAGIEKVTLPWFLWSSADKVASQSLLRHRRGEVINIPGASYRALYRAYQMLPRRWSGWAVRQFHARSIEQPPSGPVAGGMS
jgi:short-subunit dehydrogenase